MKKESQNDADWEYSGNTIYASIKMKQQNGFYKEKKRRRKIRTPLNM